MSAIKPWIINKLGNFQWQDCCQDVTHSVVVQVISTQESSTSGEGKLCGGSALVHDTQMRVTCNFTQEAVKEFERIQCGFSGCEFGDLAKYLISLDRFRVIPVLSPDVQECVFTVRVYSFSYIGPVKLRQGISDTRMAHQHGRIFNKLKELRELWRNKRLAIVSDTDSSSRSNEDELSQLVKHIQDMEQAADEGDPAETEEGGDQEMAVEEGGTSQTTGETEMHQSEMLGDRQENDGKRDHKGSLTTIFTIEMSACEKMKCPQHPDCLKIGSQASVSDGEEDSLESLQEVLDDLPVLLYTSLPDKGSKGLPEGLHDWELEAFNQKSMATSNQDLVVAMETSSTIGTHCSSSQPSEEGMVPLQWPPGSASLHEGTPSSCPASVSVVVGEAKDHGENQRMESTNFSENPQGNVKILQSCVRSQTLEESAQRELATDGSTDVGGVKEHGMIQQGNPTQNGNCPANSQEDPNAPHCGPQTLNESVQHKLAVSGSLHTGGGVPEKNEENNGEVETAGCEHRETPADKVQVLVKDTPPNDSVVSSGSGSGEGEVVVETPGVEEDPPSVGVTTSWGVKERLISGLAYAETVVMERMLGARSVTPRGEDKSSGHSQPGESKELVSDDAQQKPYQRNNASVRQTEAGLEVADMLGETDPASENRDGSMSHTLSGDLDNPASDSVDGEQASLEGMTRMGSIPEARGNSVSALPHSEDAVIVAISPGEEHAGVMSEPVQAVERPPSDAIDRRGDPSNSGTYEDTEVTEMVTKTADLSGMSDLSATAAGERSVDASVGSEEPMETQPFHVDSPEGRTPHDDSLPETQPFDVDYLVPPVVPADTESTSVAGNSAAKDSGGPSNVELATLQSSCQSQATPDTQDLRSSLMDNAFIQTQSQGTVGPDGTSITSSAPCLESAEPDAGEIGENICLSTSSASEEDIFSTCPHVSPDRDGNEAKKSPEPNAEERATTSAVSERVNNQGENLAQQLPQKRTPAKKKEKDDFDLSWIFASPVSVKEINKLLDERFSPLPESLEENRRERRRPVTPRPRSRKSLVSQFVSGLRGLKCSCGESLSQDSESPQCDSCQEEGPSRTGGAGDGGSRDPGKKRAGEEQVEGIGVRSGISPGPGPSAGGGGQKRKLGSVEKKGSGKSRRRLTDGEKTVKKAKNIREELLKLIIDEHCKRKKPKHYKKKARVTL